MDKQDTLDKLLVLLQSTRTCRKMKSIQLMESEEGEDYAVCKFECGSIIYINITGDGEMMMLYDIVKRLRFL